MVCYPYLFVVYRSNLHISGQRIRNKLIRRIIDKQRSTDSSITGQALANIYKRFIAILEIEPGGPSNWKRL